MDPIRNRIANRHAAAVDAWGRLARHLAGGNPGPDGFPSGSHRVPAVGHEEELKRD
jgi:hypothetical protein